MTTPDEPPLDGLDDSPSPAVVGDVVVVDGQPVPRSISSELVVRPATHRDLARLHPQSSIHNRAHVIVPHTSVGDTVGDSIGGDVVTCPESVGAELMGD